MHLTASPTKTSLLVDIIGFYIGNF